MLSFIRPNYEQVQLAYVWFYQTELLISTVALCQVLSDTSTVALCQVLLDQTAH